MQTECIVAHTPLDLNFSASVLKKYQQYGGSGSDNVVARTRTSANTNLFLILFLLVELSPQGCISLEIWFKNLDGQFFSFDWSGIALSP